MWKIDIAGPAASVSAAVSSLTAVACRTAPVPTFVQPGPDATPDQVKAASDAYSQATTDDARAFAAASAKFDLVKQLALTELGSYPPTATVGVFARIHENPPGSTELQISISEHP